MRAGEEVELAVGVREGGAPTQNINLIWSPTALGDGTLTPRETVTDANGIARAKLRARSAPGQISVEVRPHPSVGATANSKETFTIRVQE